MGGTRGTRISQKDLAERAGVTQATVSLALRGAAGVSAEMVNRIRELADEMGYAPNPYVSSLMRTRRQRGTGDKGMNLSWHGATTALRRQDRGRSDICDTYREMLEGARETCRRNGFGLEIFPPEKPGSHIPRVLKARGIRGLILGPIGPNRVRDLPVERMRDVHLVRLARDHNEAHYDRVVSNSFDEMRKCVDALAKAGCRRIGYIDDPGHQAASEDRWKGAFFAAQRDGVVLRPPGLWDAFASVAPVFLDDYIADQKLNGLVVGNRRYIRAMLNRWKTGERIPFACVERNGWPDWVSGVETDFRSIGGEAAQLLIDRILAPHSPERNPRTLAVHSTWHEGKSHIRPRD